MKYSRLISDYRIVMIGELKKTHEFGGYQPSDCSYFVEMKVRGGFFNKDEWVRILPSYDKEASALTKIHSIVYGEIKVIETVVWEGGNVEVRS